VTGMIYRETPKFKDFRREKGDFDKSFHDFPE